MKIVKAIYFLIVLLSVQACVSNESKTDKPSVTQEINSDIDTNYCKCGYFGMSEKGQFLAIEDSITQTILSENDSIAVYGYHSAMTKDLLFIKNGKNAEIYDLVKKGPLVTYPDSDVSVKLYRNLIDNLDSFKNINKLKMEDIDHPTAYTFSFYTKSMKVHYCICDQITDDGNSLNNMRVFFRENYVLPKVEKFRQSLEKK